MFGGGNAALGMLFFAMTATFFFGAFYLQGARGYSPFAAGLAALPAASGVMIAGPLSTRLVRRWTVRPVATTGLLGVTACMAVFALFGLGTPLVWFQDTTNSSTGIKISDPTRTHLLQPGKSVNALVNCLSTLVVGLYKLVIDYNGGVVNVAVKITL